MLCLSPLLANASATLLVYGDSLSASQGVPIEHGWVNLLRQRLDMMKTPIQVINASVGGETTDGGLRRLDDLLQRQRPQLVILELGANDGLRGFPLPVIRNNLSQLVSRIRQSGAQILLLGMHIPPNYGRRYAEGFHQMYQDIAEAEGVPLVPFMLQGVGDNPQLMQADGLHPTQEAQPRILDNLWPYLEPLLRGLTSTPTSG